MIETQRMRRTIVPNGLADVDINDIVLDALDVVESATTAVKVLRLNEGDVIAPSITQNSNGVVISVVMTFDG